MRINGVRSEEIQERLHGLYLDGKLTLDDIRETYQTWFPFVDVGEIMLYHTEGEQPDGQA